MTRERRAELEDALTEDERKQLRTVLGALSWRATQSAPWMSASVSFLQGCFKDAKVKDLIEVNKLVRTQRQFSQTHVVFHADIEHPMLLTFHDASWACRRDGTSQGGLLTAIVDQSILEGKPGVFSPIAWQSRKLPRVCRSSTSAGVGTAPPG